MSDTKAPEQANRPNVPAHSILTLRDVCTALVTKR